MVVTDVMLLEKRAGSRGTMCERTRYEREHDPSRSWCGDVVNLSEKRTVRKTRGVQGVLLENHGFEGDAHAGDWHRQVSLLAQESIDKMVDKGLDVLAGDFAENITTEGVDLLALPVGSVVRVGDSVVLEISQIGKVCHTKCAIYYQAGDCVMPKEWHLRCRAGAVVPYTSVM